MNAPADPRKVLDALTGQGDLTLSFEPAQVDRARALAAAPGAATAADVEALPDALALAVLEAAVRARALPLAEALCASARRPLAKAAKRALYQLRSLGVAVPGRKAGPSAPAAGPASPEEPLPSLASAITGNGERALIIGRPVRGRVETLQLVVADEHGVVHFGKNLISRGQYRKLLRDAAQQRDATAVELPLDEARALLAEAAGLNLRTRTPFPEGLDAALRHLDVSPAPSPLELPPPEDGDAALAARGAQLHAEPELRQWLPAVDSLRSFALKAQEIAQSPLYVDDRQRAEQLRHTVMAQAEAYFTPELSRLYGRRLWDTAALLERTGREEPARIARAEARRLFHRAPGPISPFAVTLFEKVLALSAQGAPGPPLAPPAGGAPEEATERRSAGGLILP